MNFASVVSDLRSQLGEKGHDLGFGPSPAVFRHWFDFVFAQRTEHKRLQPYRDELLAILTALDEFMAGRTLEVADILASRARYLAAGIEKGQWEIATQYLCYRMETLSLVSCATEDEAVRIVRKERRRAQELAQVSR